MEAHQKKLTASQLYCLGVGYLTKEFSHGHLHTSEDNLNNHLDENLFPRVVKGCVDYD
jgi:hypothetical protein